MRKKHRFKKRPVGYSKMQLTIQGMHCASCEVLIERKFKKIEGVESVRVHQAAGTAEVTHTAALTLDQLQRALQGTEYVVGPATTTHATTPQDYHETVRILVIVMAIYFILNRFNLIPKGLSVGENMSYGFIFVMGLVAAVSSCLAVTGGLLLAVAGRYTETHPNVSGIKRFRPHLYFNVGRVIGYTLFGGLIGVVGSVLTLSTRMTGVLTIVASLVMIFLGFQLLNIFPGLRRFQPKMPKFIAHRVHGVSESSNHPTTPFMLGAATFFLPCGFTQALQLYVLSRGSFIVGALTMLAFSLGTLPALMSLSALSSFLKGAARRYFFRFAGVVVVLLGIANINNGLALAGTNINVGRLFTNRTSQNQAVTDLPPLENGKQVISMKVVGYEYQPATFTVRQGVPVEWHINGSQAAGCAKVVIASDFNVTAALPSSGEKVVSFTPDKTGTFAFSCPMGMTTRGAAIQVVPNDEKSQISSPPNQSNAIETTETQKFTMTVTSEKGFYPTNFTAKKGIPVELEVDVQTGISGCMSTMIGSDYDIAQPLKLGKNYVRFTPTKTGTLSLTCPMGVGMGTFTII